MGLLAAGQVVIVHFPFSDLSQSKVRPAVVLAEAGRGDWLLCQITSKSYGDPRAIQIAAADLIHGSLRITSFARPGKLFTAHTSLVAGQIGELLPAKLLAVRDLNSQHKLLSTPLAQWRRNVSKCSMRRVCE